METTHKTSYGANFSLSLPFTGPLVAVVAAVAEATRMITTGARSGALVTGPPALYTNKHVLSLSSAQSFQAY